MTDDLPPELEAEVSVMEEHFSDDEERELEDLLDEFFGDE